MQSTGANRTISVHFGQLVLIDSCFFPLNPIRSFYRELSWFEYISRTPFNSAKWGNRLQLIADRASWIFGFELEILGAIELGSKMASKTLDTKPYRLAPGHVLQLSYLKKRLKHHLHLRTFIEVGSGQGIISRTLLDAGLTGLGFDLNVSACEVNREMNSEYIQSDRYQVIDSDFFATQTNQKYDLIISCMVLEHFDDSLQKIYFEKCKDLLSSNGIIITLVPSNPKHWGIEDEIAGHLRRYLDRDFEAISLAHHLKKIHCVGLTFPLSNLLLPLSNFIVRRNESKHLQLNQKEKTIQSGNRKVMFKSEFPSVFKFLINEWTLLPFLFLQKLFLRNEKSLVLYCELQKR